VEPEHFGLDLGPATILSQIRKSKSSYDFITQLMDILYNERT